MHVFAIQMDSNNLSLQIGEDGMKMADYIVSLLNPEIPHNES